MRKMLIAGLFVAGSFLFVPAAFSATGSVLLAQAGHAHGDGAGMQAMPGHGSMQHGMSSEDSNAKVSDTVEVTGCWIRALPAPAPSGGYFVVHNHGKQAIKLTGARSATYGMVMLHKTTEKNGMSSMSEAGDITIPAGGSLEFKPGGYHAMLEDAAQAPKVGDAVTLDLLFDDGTKASAQCEVRPANARVK